MRRYSLIAGEAVVVVAVLQDPGAGPGDPVPGRAAEQAAFAADHPAALAERLLRGLGPHGADRLHPPGIRLEALGQVRHLHRPVIHLHVDVGMVVAAPGRMCWNSSICLAGSPAGCPAARRRSSGSGRTGTSSVSRPGSAAASGLRRFARRTSVGSEASPPGPRSSVDAIEQRLVVPNVFGQQFIPRAFQGRIDARGHRGVRQFAFPALGCDPERNPFRRRGAASRRRPS